MKVKKNMEERVLNREVLIANFLPPDGVIEYPEPRQALFEQLYLLDEAAPSYSAKPESPNDESID
jgi:hypothetical protein